MEQSDVNVDGDGNTVLHLAARLAPRHEVDQIPNDIFKMNYELRRFKKVEKLVSPLVRGLRNANGKTADMVFADEHKHLIREAEDWMKKRISGLVVDASMVVALIYIITITFKFVPTNSSIHLESWEYKIALIALGLGVLTFCISLLMFALIITCSFTEDDFLYYIPKQYCIGLAALILSVWFWVLVMITYLISHPKQNIWLIVLIGMLIVKMFKYLKLPTLRLLFTLAFGQG